jgi:purine-cytosine permease-like protein
VAAFLGLAISSLWLMPVGIIAARTAGTIDPGAMLEAIGVGYSGAALMALATVTTNFVNLYMSSLAWKSLAPRAGQRTTVWTTGAIGAALGLMSSGWLDRYADFMLVLGGTLVPVGGILLCHFVMKGGKPSVSALYDEAGPYGRHGGWLMPGLVAWATGIIVYYAASSFGGTLPSLVASITVYWLLSRGAVTT